MARFRSGSPSRRGRTFGQAIHEEYLDNRDLIDSIYGGPDEFQKQVWDSMQYGSTIRPLGTKIEELPEEFLTLDQTPIYDLDQLAREVIDEMFGGNYTPLPVITWTNRPVSTYFGRYQPMPSPDLPRITINLLLNSKDVPREVIKYVLYHEMLHRDYRAHDKVFRGLEHRFPDWTKWDSFLDVTFPRFTIDPYGKADVQSAMSEGKTCVVGWYEEATVLRYYASMPIDEENGDSWDRWYNIIAPAEKGVLLSCEERREPRWSIPRHQAGKCVKFGFGQANIWYASEPEADDFVHQIYTQIHSYDQQE